MTNPEYCELALNSDLKKRQEYWEVAKGLQKTDGLETSDYLETLVADTLAGVYDTQAASQKISQYYERLDPSDPDYQNREADIVATRITLVLERGGFKFSPSTLLSLHSELFQDILPYKWVGNYRTTNIEKSETVLNGLSVQYADHSTISANLEHDFDREKQKRYSLPFTSDQIRSFSEFVSNIWQTHPFREGNTRTIATFAILYLQNLGIEVNNEPFKTKAKFFRDALVRNNFSNIQAGIYPDSQYLYMFFENALAFGKHDLTKIPPLSTPNLS